MSKVPTAKSGRSPLTLEENERRFMLYQQGLSDSQIAKACGVSKVSIRNWRNRRGLNRDSKAPVEEEKVEKIEPKGRTNKYQPLTPEEEARRFKLYWQGLSDIEIAKTCGLAPGTVHRWRMTRNLPSNSKKTRLALQTAQEESTNIQKGRTPKVMYRVTCDGKIENHLFPWMNTYTELKE